MSKRTLWGLWIRRHCGSFARVYLTGATLFFSVPELLHGATDKVTQPLVGGTVISKMMLEELGLLTLNTARGVCSASLLNNEWAITAAHCLEVIIGQPPTVAPGSVTLTGNWDTVQTRTGVQINSFRGSGFDVAIVRVNQPFLVNKSRSGFKRLALDVAPENLQNYFIEVFGRGINRFATGSGPTAIPSQSDGQYRVGQATIVSYQNNLNWNDYATASVAGGDSGGPSMATIYAGRVLTGVHALCKLQCVPGQTCGTWRGPGPAPAGYSPWQWVSATPQCADAPVRPLWAEIWQIIDSSPKAGPGPLTAADVLEKDAVRLRPPQYVGQFDYTYYSRQFLYGVTADGNLFWYSHVIGVDKNPPKEPSARDKALNTASQVGRSGGAAAQTRTNPLAVGVTQPAGPRVFHQMEGPRQVGSSWQSFVQIIPAGQSGFYGLSADGSLKWYRHDGFADGTAKWKGPVNPGGPGSVVLQAKATLPAAAISGGAVTTPPGGSGSATKQPTAAASRIIAAAKSDQRVVATAPSSNVTSSAAAKQVVVGSGVNWLSFKKIVAGGDGVLYAVGADGSVYWYRHQDYTDPLPKPNWAGPVQVASGWQNFVHVFSTGEGIIYAVQPNGDLVWMRHRGYLDGKNLWDAAKKIGNGWAGFKRVFSSDSGRIYALRADGALLWYQHDGYQDGSMRWQGPAQIQADWGNFVHVFARMEGTPRAPVVR